MGHSVIPEIAKSNKYWIPAYRFLELKYFCLQYPDWKKEAYDIMTSIGSTNPNQNGVRGGSVEFNDPTGEAAMKLSKLNSKISLVGKIAKMSSDELDNYILKGVTEKTSFVKLKTIYEIPCERDMYYDRYRKFFYLLSRERD